MVKNVKLGVFQDEHHNKILALISCIEDDSQLLPCQVLAQCISN